VRRKEAPLPNNIGLDFTLERLRRGEDGRRSDAMRRRVARNSLDYLPDEPVPQPTWNTVLRDEKDTWRRETSLCPACETQLTPKRQCPKCGWAIPEPRSLRREPEEVHRTERKEGEPKVGELKPERDLRQTIETDTEDIPIRPKARKRIPNRTAEALANWLDVGFQLQAVLVFVERSEGLQTRRLFESLAGDPENETVVGPGERVRQPNVAEAARAVGMKRQEAYAIWERVHAWGRKNNKVFREGGNLLNGRGGMTRKKKTTKSTEWDNLSQKKISYSK
jgi:hypothetical protein